MKGAFDIVYGGGSVMIWACTRVLQTLVLTAHGEKTVL